MGIVFAGIVYLTVILGPGGDYTGEKYVTDDPQECAAAVEGARSTLDALGYTEAGFKVTDCVRVDVVNGATGGLSAAPFEPETEAP